MVKQSLRTARKSKANAEVSHMMPMMAELYRRAEAQVKKQPISKPANPGPDPRALLHELQVHQVELEMQNVALQEAQQLMEQSLERYTDLYDFAPIAYFTLDAAGIIQQANLAAARLVGIDRVDLIGRGFARLLVPGMRPRFNAFLKTAFGSEEKQTAEFDLLAPAAPPCSLSIDAQCAPGGTECRLVAIDITERKRSEQARMRLEVLAATNRKLEQEIAARQEVERSLRESERHHRNLLIKSKRMQNELRRLSHVIIETQEEERLRISRELHDQITQTLVSISYHLHSLAGDTKIDPRLLRKQIVRTQTLVEQSVEIIHNFARDLRPPALDHFGLIHALKALVSEFIDQTKIQARLTTLPEVESVNSGRRIAIYRVVQSALSNVAKHSKAKNVIIQMHKEARCILLTIADDGKSFDARRLHHANADRRLGLLGMRERIEMVGGWFEIEGKPGEGTTVRARIPLVGRKLTVSSNQEQVPPESRETKNGDLRGKP